MVVGPEGSGKTTLLEQIEPHLAERGWRVRRLQLRPGEIEAARWRPFLDELETGDLLLLDGLDHLAPVERLQLLRRSGRAGGLIATSHRPERFLPTLLDCRTTPELLEAIARDLGGSEADGLPFAELHRRHAGNIRTALRELYDLWAGR